MHLHKDISFGNIKPWAPPSSPTPYVCISIRRDFQFIKVLFLFFLSLKVGTLEAEKTKCIVGRRLHCWFIRTCDTHEGNIICRWEWPNMACSKWKFWLPSRVVRCLSKKWPLRRLVVATLGWCLRNGRWLSTCIREEPFTKIIIYLYLQSSQVYNGWASQHFISGATQS